VAQGQLGVSSRSRGGGGELELEWFGARLVVGADRQRPLGDEVAIDLAPLLAANGLTARASGSTLLLEMPTPRLLGIRPSTSPPGLRRVVSRLSSRSPTTRATRAPKGIAMATTPTTGCNPTSWSSSSPQSSSWMARGTASSRRISSAGQARPRQVLQRMRELARPRTTPSTRLTIQPSKAMPTVVAKPERAERSTSGSSEGVKAARTNWASKSRPPPCT
jgi:hypothetical protein